MTVTLSYARGPALRRGWHRVTCVYNRWETGAALPRLDTLVQLADTLEVSLDELVGRTAIDDSELRLRNPKLHLLYREIDRLSDEDQKALVILLDSLVKRSQMGKVLAG